jgi:predicted enzyme related to lactoylglutathione lyase
MNLQGVMIGSEDSNALAIFYKKAFGEPMMNDGDWYVFVVGQGSIMIGNHSKVSGKSAEPARIMIAITSQDVAKDFESLKAAGATVVAEPYQPNKDDMPKVWLATLADPDGNYVQLNSPWEGQ